MQTHSKDCYGWTVPPKPEPLYVKEQLPASDMEKVKEFWERTDRELEKHRLPGQEDFKDATRQRGKCLNSNELVRIVLRMNPKLFVEDSLNCKGHAAFYIGELDGTKRYTGANFQKGILPEFSVIETDKADLPVRVQYGWREVLLRLVKAQVLSFAEVLKVFGDTHTVQSTPWRRNVQKFRT